jgi:hypothetical protein
MSQFSVPIVMRGQLVSVEAVGETQQDAVAQAAANNPSASAVAGPASPNVGVSQPAKTHGHSWPHP